MENEKEYLQVDPGVAKGEKSLDELAEELGVDKPPNRPVEVTQPETNPDHGPEHELPEEHQVPVEEAIDKVKEK